MAEDEDGPTADQGGASGRSRENRDRDQTGITGDAAVKGARPAPGASADDGAAIDLDSAHDRAS